MSQALGQEPTRWLSENELTAWRGLQQMQARLSAKLNRELSGEFELSLQDYTVLVVLSEATRGQLRSFELGQELGWEKSRLSHHIARMVTRDLVRRHKCPSDQRGLYIGITAKGERVLKAAAPGHATAVREAFINFATPEQLQSLADLTTAVVNALKDECGSTNGA